MMQENILYKQIEAEDARMVSCLDCQGTGRSDDSETYVNASGEKFAMHEPCSTCNGSAKMWEYDTEEAVDFAYHSDFGKRISSIFFAAMAAVFLALIIFMVSFPVIGVRIALGMDRVGLVVQGIWVGGAITAGVGILAMFISVVIASIGQWRLDRAGITQTKTYTEPAELLKINSPAQTPQLAQKTVSG